MLFSTIMMLMMQKWIPHKWWNRMQLEFPLCPNMALSIKIPKNNKFDDYTNDICPFGQWRSNTAVIPAKRWQRAWIAIVCGRQFCLEIWHQTRTKYGFWSASKYRRVALGNMASALFWTWCVLACIWRVHMCMWECLCICICNVFLEQGADVYVWVSLYLNL